MERPARHQHPRDLNYIFHCLCDCRAYDRAGTRVGAVPFAETRPSLDWNIQPPGVVLQLLCDVLLPYVVRDCLIVLCVNCRYAYSVALPTRAELSSHLGLHLFPNAASMSLGAVFAGYVCLFYS